MFFSRKRGNIQSAWENVESGWCFSLSSTNLEEGVLAFYLKELCSKLYFWNFIPIFEKFMCQENGWALWPDFLVVDSLREFAKIVWIRCI